jgi:hypothetical protein
VVPLDQADAASLREFAPILVRADDRLFGASEAPCRVLGDHLSAWLRLALIARAMGDQNRSVQKTAREARRDLEQAP